MAATSNFIQSFESVLGVKVTTGTMELLPYGNSYPTGKLALTHVADGVWHRDATPDGEYSLYYNGNAVTKYARFWIGENKLSIVATKFGADGTPTQGLADEVRPLLAEATGSAKGLESASDKAFVDKLIALHDANGRLYPAGTLFIQPGKNLFNSTEAVINKYVNNSDGIEASASGFCCTPYIPVNGNTQYIDTDPTPVYGDRWQFYDTNKAWISYTMNNNLAFTTPSNARYMRRNLALHTADISSAIQTYMLEQGSTRTAYEPYGYRLGSADGLIKIYIDDNSVVTSKIANSSITTVKIADANVLPSKTNFIKLRKNLFSKASAKSGYYVGDSDGIESQAASLCVTGYIEILPSTAYVERPTAYGNYWHFYDINKAWISKQVVSGSTFTSPANARYMRRNIALGADTFTNALNTYQLEAGTVATSYQPYSFTFIDTNGSAMTTVIDDGVIENIHLSPNFSFKIPTIKTTISNLKTASDFAGQLGKDTNGENYIAQAVGETTQKQIPSMGQAKNDILDFEVLRSKMYGLRNAIKNVNYGGTDENNNWVYSNNITWTQIANNSGLINSGYIPFMTDIVVTSATSPYLRTASNLLPVATSPTSMVFGAWFNETQLLAWANAQSNKTLACMYLAFYDNSALGECDITANQLLSLIANIGYSITYGVVNGILHYTPTLKSVARSHGYIYLQFTAGSVTGSSSALYFYLHFGAATYAGLHNTILAPVVLINETDIYPYGCYMDDTTVLKTNIMTKSEYEAFLAVLPSIKDKIRVLKSGNDIFVRSYFNELQDVVIWYSIDTANNLNISITGTYLINKSVTDSVANYTAGTLIHSCGDDITPFNTANTAYIGANHGFNTANVVVGSHDKTSADVGSVWSDGTNQWILANIIDSTHLNFAFKNTGVEGTWTSGYSVSGSTLTHVSGATHTGTITISSQSLLQALPITKNRVKKYLIDGKTDLPENVLTVADYFDIVDQYDVIDPSTLTYSYPMVWSNGSSWFRYKHVYRFSNYGAVTIDATYEILRKLNLGYFGVIQAIKLYKGSYDKIFAYMPKVKSNNGYDFKAIQDFTSNPSVSLEYTSAYLDDTANPPDRLVEFLGDTDGTKRVGFAHGFNINYDAGKKTNRANNITPWNIYTSGKSYPRVNDFAGLIDAGTVFHTVAYRQYFDPQLYSGTTAVYFHKVGSNYFLYIDVHQTVSNLIINLPDFLLGKEITLIEKDDNVTLKTSEIVSGDGVILSVANNYGFVVLKLV